MTDIEQAARAYVAAHEKVRDARNGLGHEGEPHDAVLRYTGSRVHDLIGECATCGGAIYGAEELENAAMGDLREALGLPRRPWEVR